MTQRANPVYWRSLVVFGDSFSDSGAGYVDGNGPTAIAVSARLLGIPLVPSTDESGANAGINFAVSGGKTGEGEGERIRDALLGRGLRTQVRDYLVRVEAGRVKLDSAHTLFFIAGGLNDGDQTTSWTVANLEQIVHDVHAAGGRNFLIALLPTQLPAFQAVGQRLNPAITAMVGELSRRLPDARIRVSRWGEYFDEVMTHASSYGLMNTTGPCAGRALFDEDSRPVGDPDRYFYYHRDHPSAAVHRAVAVALRRELIAAIPV